MTEMGDSKKYLNLFQKLVTALKDGDHENIQKATNLVISNPEVTKQPDIFKFVIIILLEPVVFIQLLLALVYMQTFGSKRTKKIDELFENLEYNDTINLCESDNAIFYRDKTIESNIISNEAIRENASLFDFLIVKQLLNASPDLIDITINNFVKIANSLLENKAGSKALKSCQIAVYTSSAATMLVSYGCENQIADLTKEQCEKAQIAKHNLLDPIASE
jgi:hypothetical protein